MKIYKAVSDKLHTLAALGTVPADRKVIVPHSWSEYSAEARSIIPCQETKASRPGPCLTTKLNELSQPFLNWY